MSRLSLQVKVGITISALVLGFMAYEVGYQPRRLERQLLTQAEANARKVSHFVGQTLLSALASSDSAGLAKTMDGLGILPGYVFCSIYDEKGLRRGVDPPNPPWVTPTVPAHGVRYVDPGGEWGTLLVISTPIHHRLPLRDREGTLVIGFTTEDTRLAVRDCLRRGWIASLAALVMGVGGFVFLLQGHLIPLKKLAEAARQAAQDHLGGPLIRFDVSGELQDLGSSLEAMTSRLRAPQEDIARRSRLQEFQVEERTRQLMATIRELEEIRTNLEHLVQERTQGLEESRAELRAWAATLEEKVREKTLELTELNQGLLASFQKLQQVDRMKDEFLANMSHELRTPLNAVIGFSDLLLQEPPERMPDDVKADLRIILQNGRSLLSMIDAILDLSKLEAGRFELESQEMDPMPILEEVGDHAKALIQDRPIRLVVSPPPQRVAIQGEPQRFKQVLTNIVGNAVKFTEKGEVSLSVEQGPGILRIAIKDTGIGMNQDEVSRLFQPFQQVDGSLTRRFGGAGLGLAVSQRLIGLMGGRITVASEKGVGSTFAVEVPSLPPEAP